MRKKLVNPDGYSLRYLVGSEVAQGGAVCEDWKSRHESLMQCVVHSEKKETAGQGSKERVSTNSEQNAFL